MNKGFSLKSFHGLFITVILEAKLAFAGAAELLFLEADKPVLASAENAGFLILCKEYLVSFNVDFYGVGVAYIHLLTHLDGYYDASEIINVTNDTC